MKESMAYSEDLHVSPLPSVPSSLRVAASTDPISFLILLISKVLHKEYYTVLGQYEFSFRVGFSKQSPPSRSSLFGCCTASSWELRAGACWPCSLRTWVFSSLPLTRAGLPRGVPRAQAPPDCLGGWLSTEREGPSSPPQASQTLFSAGISQENRN